MLMNIYDSGIMYHLYCMVMQRGNLQAYDECTLPVPRIMHKNIYRICTIRAWCKLH